MSKMSDTIGHLTLSEFAHTSPEELERMRKKFYDMFPNLRAFRRDVTNQIATEVVCVHESVGEGP